MHMIYGAFAIIGAVTVGGWIAQFCIYLRSDPSGNSGRFGHFSGLIHDPLTGSSTKENDK